MVFRKQAWTTVLFFKTTVLNKQALLRFKRLYILSTVICTYVAIYR